MAQSPLFPVTVVGSWPRSAALIQALRKKQSGEMSPADFETLADQEVMAALRAQEDAGVDILTDGEQRREIFYRPVQPAARNFTARVDAGARACLADISGAPGLKLVDTRSREEFTGVSDADEKPGHIPGAVNIVWQELVGVDGRLLCSEEKARQVLAAAGINRNDRIVAYCKVGVRAAVAYLAFKRLGYDVRLYDASYAEWERSGLPVEKGEPSSTKEGSPGSD